MSEPNQLSPPPPCPPRRHRPQLIFILICVTSSMIIGLSSFYLYYPGAAGPGRRTEPMIEEGGPDQSPDTQLNSSDDNAPERSSQSSTQSFQEPILDHQQTSNSTNYIRNRLVHFDLKGAPPRIGYLKEIIHLSHLAGATGILLEYEDTFPWSGPLINMTLVQGSYTIPQLIDLTTYIESLGLDLIPLIQTFGHVEFILKGEEFSHLRERPEDPQAFCPSQPGTLEIVEEMVRQVLRVHRTSRFLHIGCDEVFNLRMCKLCMDESNTRDELFLQHVLGVGKIVRAHGRIPIIWDDMLRSIPERTLHRISTIVEPMVWVYAEDVDRFIGYETWEKYASIFPTIWTAGAYKGAFGERLSIPPLTRHALNAQRWMNVVSRESTKWNLGLGGFVLTGWQRYDHFAVLCELIPASVPSLIYSLLVVGGGDGGGRIRNRVFQRGGFEIMVEEGNEPIGGELDVSQPMGGELIDGQPIGGDLTVSQPINRHLTTRKPIIKETKPHRRHRRRTEPLLSHHRRWIPHPQTLRTKETIKQQDQPTPSPPPPTNHIWKDYLRILSCPADLPLTSDPTHCNFPGSRFYRSLFQLHDLVQESWETVDNLKRRRGWMTDYNIRHAYSLPLRVDELLHDVSRLKRNLSLKAKSLANSLKSVYENHVILEWLEQNVWEVWTRLDTLEKEGDLLKRQRIWERRPLRGDGMMIRDLGLRVVGLGGGGGGQEEL